MYELPGFRSSSGVRHRRAPCARLVDRGKETLIVDEPQRERPAVKSNIVSPTLMVCAVLSGCTSADSNPNMGGQYLGQEPPGRTAEQFAPDILPQGESQGCSGFLDDATVFVFGSMAPHGDWRLRTVYEMRLENGIWTDPRIAPFSSYAPYNFTVGPDGNTLYFTTLKSPDTTTRMFLEEANIWAVTLEMDGWSEPVMFGRSINTESHYENYPAVTNDGTVYYMSRREDGVGRTDIYRSRNNDGRYGEAENLGPPINTAVSDIDPFVAPDESYLIFCQDKLEGLGGLDLYVSFRHADGSWLEPQNLGPNVNSSAGEARPYVTTDGRYLFFTSNRAGDQSLGKIYWVDAGVIEDLRPSGVR